MYLFLFIGLFLSGFLKVKFSLQKKTKKNPASETKTKLKMMKKTKKNPNRRGVVYLGHIPHGFYEEELRGFFSQFGKVSRVKVSRSSKVRIKHNMKFGLC